MKVASLSNLSDKQNHLLTQLSYQSHILGDEYNGQSLKKIYEALVSRLGEKNKDVKEFKRYIDAGLGDIIIKDVANDKISGFGAIAFEDAEGNVGITYRGTDGIRKESINDWVGNVVAAVTGTSVQTVQAEKFFKKNMDANGNNYLYGHSKGGNLSQSVFVNNYKKIKLVHNLNPQPINPFGLTIEQRKALNSNKMDIVVTEGDYVWFLGNLGYWISRIRVMDNSCGGDAHGYNEKRYNEKGDIIAGTQPVLEYIGLDVISALTINTQLIGGAIQRLYNCGVKAIDFIKKDMVPKAKEVIDSVVDSVRRISAEYKKYADSIKNYFTKVLSKARAWYSNSYNFRNGSAYVDSIININTNTMVTYANQLYNLSKRSKRLDSNMNSLYWQLGIEWDSIANLGKLLRSNAILSYAYRLDRCADCLIETANEFNRVEEELRNLC